MSGESKVKPPDGLIDTNLEDLEIAWPERLQEADVLDAAGFHSTAAALRLYSLEMLIKVVICKHLGLAQLPAVCKTHDFGNLIIHTGRWKDLQVKPPTKLRANWDILVLYSRSRLNDLRYKPRGEWTPEDMLKIREALYGSTDAPEDGVATWLSKDT